MLDVHGRDDVGTGAYQLLYVLVTLAVPRTRGIGVGELVHDSELRLALQDCVYVHLSQRCALIIDVAWRDCFEVANQSQRLSTAVCFDHTNDDAMPLSTETVRLFKHAISFAYTSGAANVDLKDALFDFG